MSGRDGTWFEFIGWINGPLGGPEPARLWVRPEQIIAIGAASDERRSIMYLHSAYLHDDLVATACEPPDSLQCRIDQANALRRSFAELPIMDPPPPVARDDNGGMNAIATEADASAARLGARRGPKASPKAKGSPEKAGRAAA